MDKFTAHLTVDDCFVSIEAYSLQKLTGIISLLNAEPAQQVIKFDDRPDVGSVPAAPVVDMQQAAASLAFSKTPDQLVAANAAVTAPPVVPPLPAALVTPPAAPAQGDVDSEGVRWDPRIHSSTRTTVASGAWRIRKGADSALIEQVKAEQRALNALPVAPVVPVAPVAPVTPPPPPAFITPEAAAIPVAPVAPAFEPITDFSKFCEWLNGPMLTMPPKLTMEDVTACVTKHGMKALPDLLQRADWIPVIHAELHNLVASR